MKFYLTRHGESQWNVERRLQGSFNSSLTKKGRGDSYKLSHFLKEEHLQFDKIYTSVSSRAVETAKIIAENMGSELVTKSELKEMDTGSWQGRTWSEIEQLYPIEYKRYWNAPHLYQALNGGEDFHHVQRRVMNELQKMIEENTDQTLLIVSHGVVLHSILNYYLGQPLERFWERPMMQGASLSLLEFNGDQARVVYQGFDDYLIS